MKGYDSSQYEKMSVAVDLLVFTIENDRLKILLIERSEDPYANVSALPGVFVGIKETLDDAVKRGIKEETGLTVIPSSVKEFGYVHRIQKGEREAMFVQDNYYYFCDVEELRENVEFTADEIREDFVPMFMPIEEAIKINREFPHTNEMYDAMIERERRVMEMIVEENKTRI